MSRNLDTEHDSFAYDAANRLISATVGGSGETYSYDGDGVRSTRTVGANPVISYVSDVNRDLPVTLDDGTRKYVWGLGLAYAVSGSSVEVYHADRLGSVRAITDGSGSVVASYRTDAWGNPTGQTGSSTQPYGFTGEPVDASSLVYLRARYYDPGLGRFMTRDLWAGDQTRDGTLNRFSYAMNTPSSLTDPSGQTPTSVILGGKKPSNQFQNRQFENAVTECERRLQITITGTNRRRQLHNAMDPEVKGYQDILAICLEMFGPSPEVQPDTGEAKCTTETNWDETCRWNPFGGGGFVPVPVVEPAPIPLPGFGLPPIGVPFPGFGFGFVF